MPRLATGRRLLAVTALAAVACAPRAPSPPVLAELPAFELVDHEGRPGGSASLAGKVWLADFIFTTCPTVCERLTRELKALEAELDAAHPGVQLVSFTVDPEHDTPEVLRGYAARHGLDLSRWRFFTGELGAVKDAIVRGFKLPMGDKQPPGPDPSFMQIAHSTRVVLVDRAGRIRGYFEAGAEGRAALLAAVAAVEREPAPAAR
jgi:protein SCO1/2